MPGIMYWNPADRNRLLHASTYIFAGMDYAETYKAAQGVDLLLGRLCTV
jgi:hypothetical protein